MTVAHPNIKRARQGYRSWHAADPKRKGMPITKAQVDSIRAELKIIKGNENVLIALVYDKVGREGVRRLEDMDLYEVQVAFELLLMPEVRSALRTHRRPGGEQSA